MAKYPAEQFGNAARAFFSAHGLTDAADTDGTKAKAKALATKLGDKNPATPELLRVVKLRDSIARRFVRISVQALAKPVKAPKGSKTAAKAPAKSKAKATAKAAPKANGSAKPKNGNGNGRKAEPEAAPVQG